MKYLYIFIIALTISVCRAQNLVPNPSFEAYTLCPSAIGQITLAIPWSAATTDASSTDYFNSCSSVFSVPSSPGGFQYARTGNAYARIVFIAPTNQREYLQVQLVSPLIMNKNYYVEFYVNSTNDNFNSSCNNIAANLSITRPVSNSTYSLQPLIPHIMNPGNPIISDTLNWVKVSGCYTAQGGEEYITIGNFFNDLNTQIAGPTLIAVYYIDDVLVEEITGTCVTGIKEMSDESGIMRVYPNPNNGTFSIAYNFEQSGQEFMMYDVMGKLIKRIILESNEGVKQFTDTDLSNGIYYYKVVNQANIIVTGKLVINK